MDVGTRELVRRRAAGFCEYCHLREEDTHPTHHIEHIIPKKHRGTDDPANLALSCERCNHNKGPNLTGIDPVSGEIVHLFHPRRDRWHEHFRWDGTELVG